MVAESAPAPDYTAEQLIEQIATHNPTASRDFLSGFSPTALLNYLSHLIACQEPRGRLARWVRPDETPAIMRWEPVI